MMMQEQMSEHNINNDFNPVTASGRVIQFLTFELSADVYGINILNIKEIIAFGKITRVPMMPSFIAGVINLRGSVVPVVDLALRFDKLKSAVTKRSSIVIVEVKDEDGALEIGISVDEVNEVLDILSDEINPAPTFGTKIRTDFIFGIAKIDAKSLVLLDVDNMLSIDEISQLDNL
jgi:purine-binding chemotaxis protein CheW